MYERRGLRPFYVSNSLMEFGSPKVRFEPRERDDETISIRMFFVNRGYRQRAEGQTSGIFTVIGQS